MHYKKFGKKIIDSTGHLNVNVKEIDTKEAICSDHQRCVIAKAIKRETKAKWVDVGADIVFISFDKDTAKRYRLSPKAKEQVRYFDKKGRFAPCIVKLYKSKIFGTRRGYKARSGKSRGSYKQNKPTR